MTIRYNVSVVSWQQLFILVLLCIGTFALFKQLDRYVVTSGNLVNLPLLNFKTDSDIKPGNVLILDNVISLYSAKEDIVSVWEDIDVFSITEYIKVSATIKTDNVGVSENHWDGARVVFVEKDENGKFYYHKPHLVGAISGNVNVINVSRIFNNEKAKTYRRLLLELHNVRGAATFSNIEVYSMDVSANFGMMRIIVGIIWLASIVWYFFSTVKKITRKGLAAWTLLVLIVLGALVPGEVKAYVNQATSTILCLFNFCNYSSIANKYPSLVKYGFIYESGIVNVFKFGHLVLFTMMSFFLIWMVERIEYIKVVVFMLVLAAATEILQMMFITRTPSFHDLYIDATGILIGAFFAILFYRAPGIKDKQVINV